MTNSAPAGRIQMTLFPSLPARQLRLTTQIVRSALTFQSPNPNRSALGSFGGSARIGLEIGQPLEGRVPWAGRRSLGFRRKGRYSRSCRFAAIQNEQNQE